MPTERIRAGPLERVQKFLLSPLVWLRLDSPEEETTVARMYKGHIVRGSTTPGKLTEAETVLADLLGNSPARRVVDFGVSYAYVDSLLAAKSPDVQFIGIDRSKAVCDLNSADFTLPNMTFLASDIDAWIDAQTDLSDSSFTCERLSYCSRIF